MTDQEPSWGPRTFRGTRPQFFETPGVDHAISMIMALAQEFCVLHDRQDTLEKIAASKGVVLDGEIDGYKLSDDELRAREEWRGAFFKRLFHLMQQQIEEQRAVAK